MLYPGPAIYNLQSSVQNENVGPMFEKQENSAIKGTKI